MNSICSDQSKGWICVRAQHLENVIERHNPSNKQKKNANNTVTAMMNWCSGAEDWGDEFCDDDGFDKNISSNNPMQLVAQQQPFDDNLNEQNGNTVCNNMVMAKNENRNVSDDEDESNSMDSDPIPLFGNLQVIDDKNANCGEQGEQFVYILKFFSSSNKRKHKFENYNLLYQYIGGAVGLLNSPSASAEIEGEESEMVCVDAPIAPERDLIALLKQTQAIPNDINNLVLKSYFITVEEERKQSSDFNNALVNDHIRDLLHKYHGEEESM